MKKPRHIKKADIKNYWVGVMGYSEYDNDYSWDDLSTKQQLDCIEFNL